ncbi:benzoate 4-monooxygenase cytochrome P450 [Stachybotrys elegans]|uniref:Benzoate 4-monooxygenase cytochrome P450 n=1 Tax=Stachybotrys elegans TaxID=80388 RepID=A0A8K0WKJ9_9HYPO|nr:benzoate 4-monooxygenase cytochrome P450 [Stachybotrys elegans]
MTIIARATEMASDVLGQVQDAIVANPTIVKAVAGVAAAALVTRAVVTYMRLSNIPGPLVAKFTNLQRAGWVWSFDAHNIHIKMHEKFGNVVRFGPNMVSLADPREIPKIYKMHNPLIKSDYYHVILPRVDGEIMPSLFPTQDEALHRKMKRPIGGVYSMSNLTSFESLVDNTIEVFLQQINTRFINAGKAFDFGQWVQYFAFDVIGEITFSKRLGFLERGVDVDALMGSIWLWFNYTSVVGQMPWLDYVLAKNPAFGVILSMVPNPLTNFAQARREERLADRAAGKPVSDRDFLARFLEAFERDPSLPSWTIKAWTISNVLAGSDTTAIFLRTMFKNLVEKPETMARLRKELEDARENGELSRIVSWKEAKKLPFLEACVHESGRIHPPFGLHLERIAPEGGIEIEGKFIPEGTVVGMNAWVVHRNKDVFGEDADTWRPERWMEADADKRKLMESCLLTFGAGHRTCLGKHISLLEIYKLVPTMLMEYDFKFVDPKKPWTVKNRWFVPQFDMNMILSKREGATVA